MASANSPVRPPAPDPLRNQLLAALPRDEYERLRPYLEVVYLANSAVIYGPGEVPSTALFPLTGVASTIVSMADGAIIEAGSVGREGVIGMLALGNSDSGPLSMIAQVPGHYARMDIKVFRAAAAQGALLNLLKNFLQAFYVQVAQSAGCNRLHPVAARCARWLLLTHDRTGLDTFHLTHEYLGYMLGARRASVTIAAGLLQRAGLIAYQRGVITILDRPGLEAAACECYAIIRDEFSRLLGTP